MSTKLQHYVLRSVRKRADYLEYRPMTLVQDRKKGRKQKEPPRLTDRGRQAKQPQIATSREREGGERERERERGRERRKERERGKD